MGRASAVPQRKKKVRPKVLDPSSSEVKAQPEAQQRSGIKVVVAAFLLPTFSKDLPGQHPDLQRHDVEVVVATTPSITIMSPNSSLNRSSAHVTDTLAHTNASIMWSTSCVSKCYPGAWLKINTQASMATSRSQPRYAVSHPPFAM